MDTELIKANQETWSSLLHSYEEESMYCHWKEHNSYGIQILRYGIEQGFNNYFRVGASMYTLFFSTLEYPLWMTSPCVYIDVEQDNRVTLSYVHAVPKHSKDHCLRYSLDMAEALPTFRRFLNHVWTLTQSEPMPYELRRPDFYAPVLTDGSRFIWPEHYVFRE